MPIIPDGVYNLTKLNDQTATVIIASAPSDLKNKIVVLPVSPGNEPKWIVVNVSNGNVTIQNVGTGKFLGFRGEPEVNKFCEQTIDPVEWHIQPTAEQRKFHVVFPGGPVGGSDLVFDISPLKIDPPLMALSKLRVQEVEQAWGFVSQKN